MEIIGNILYVFMLFVAFFSALIMYSVKLKKCGFSKYIRSKIKSSFFWSLIIGALGSNIIRWFFIDGLIDESLYFRFTQGGFSFYFGLITFFAAFSILLYFNKLNVKICLNLSVPSIILAQLLARIGCIFGGCCKGREISLFGILFNLPYRGLEILFTIVLLIIFIKWFHGKRFFIYIFSYSAFRFVFEFLRGDYRGDIFGFSLVSPTQILAFLISLVCLFIALFNLAIKIFKAEEIIDEYKTKIKEFKNNNFKKRHYVLALDFTPEKQKGKTLKILKSVFVVFLCFTVVISGIIYANPLGMSFFENIKYKTSDALSFIFAQKGTEQEIGQLNGSNLLLIADDYTVVDETSAKDIVTKYDPWTNPELVLIKKEILPNENIYYSFIQVIDGKPVMGTGRILVTDKNNKVIYIAGDPSHFTYSSEKSNYNIPTPTIKEAFGEDIIIIEEKDCWYDTGEGLIAAKYVIISKEGKKTTTGVIIESETGRILCLTGINYGTVYTTESKTIENAIGEVSELLEQDNKQKLKEIAKTRHAQSEIEEDRHQLMRALSKVYEKSGLTEYEFELALNSSKIIAENTPGISYNLYKEILIKEAETVLVGAGKAEMAEKCSKKINKTFKSCGIEDTEDEVAISLTANERKSSFKHSIDSKNDQDMYTLSKQENHTLEIEVKAEEPVEIFIYNNTTKQTVTSMYVEDSEEIILYPEDGTDFTVRVSSGLVDPTTPNEPSEYKIILKSEEEKDSVPVAINSAFFRIESAYDSSNVMPFLGMCYDEEMSIEEMLALTFATPVVDSCAGCIGEEEVIDTAKSTIAMVLIPDADNYSELEYLRDTDIELTYFDHREIQESIVVKAKIRIKYEEMDIYNGFTFFKLEQKDRYNIEDQDIEKIFKFLGGITGTNYYITELNTETLYNCFGDTAGNISSTSDMTSLYELQNPTVVEHDGMQFALLELDEEKAAGLGHSKEKIDSFHNYTTRQNITSLKQLKAYLEIMQNTLQTINACGEPVKTIAEFITDPIGTPIGIICEQNEITNGLYTLYEAYMDLDGLIVDTVLDAAFEVAGQLADELGIYIESIDELIGVYRQKMR